VFVKSPVFPFVRFPGVDTILGPEMRSTGEVMGGADGFGVAFAKAMMSTGQTLPQEGGRVFISVNNSDKPTVLPIAKDLAALGFTLSGSRGTAAYLQSHGLDVEVIYKVNEGRPNVADRIVNGEVHLVINTPLGRESFFDDRAVRRAATMAQVPCITRSRGPLRPSTPSGRCGRTPCRCGPSRITTRESAPGRKIARSCPPARGWCSASACWQRPGCTRRTRFAPA
jgi:carbamoyl-phosphate synthase large subunit